MIEIRIEDASALDTDCAADASPVEEFRIFEQLPLLQELLDAVPNSYLILNDRRQIVFANQALYAWLRAPDIGDVMGLLPGDALNCTHAVRRDSRCGTTDHCMTCGALRALTSSDLGQEAIQECRITQESSQALDLRVWTTPFTLQGNRFTLFAIHDISHEKRRYALERVFFHDVLNTANSVQGFARLLIGAPPDEQEDMISILAEMADQLVDEIRAQQMISSAESGDLNVNTVSVNSLAIVREAAQLYGNHESAMGRILDIDPASTSTEFDSDPVLLRRVLGNMIVNALEACAPGQTVTVGCHGDAEGEVAFTVRNPQYMSREVQLQVFQRSYSTKGAGRGLGSYSVKLLSERYLQGRVGFSTSREEGTTFTARFPRRLLPPWMVA